MVSWVTVVPLGPGEDPLLDSVKWLLVEFISLTLLAGALPQSLLLPKTPYTTDQLIRDQGRIKEK